MKQALRSAGANQTMSHMEVSLCAIFLMDAAKKVDTQLGVTKSSTRHTIRDSARDIAKMVAKLLEEHVCKEDHERERRDAPVFHDLLVKGMERVGRGWIKAFLDKHDTDPEWLAEGEEEIERISDDFQYELYDVSV